MSLLELEHVSKRFRHGVRAVEALCDVCLQVHEGEVVGIWGPGRSGRSTLLRIAGAIEAPDEGVVRLRGRELELGSGAMAGGIAYCQPRFRSLEGQRVCEELIASQLALGMKPASARARAQQELERVGASHCEERRPFELERAEEVRVAIARALMQGPSLLLVDEPTKGVSTLERKKILELLRSLRSEGIAVLMTLDKGIGLFGSDRALSLAEGTLRGHVAPELAAVVELPLRVSG
jgi:ABC-type lipoprotein export system ATPase subunit